MGFVAGNGTHVRSIVAVVVVDGVEAVVPPRIPGVLDAVAVAMLGVPGELVHAMLVIVVLV